METCVTSKFLVMCEDGDGKDEQVVRHDEGQGRPAWFTSTCVTFKKFLKTSPGRNFSGKFWNKTLHFQLKSMNVIATERTGINRCRLKNSVPDPWHFDMDPAPDPDPALFVSGFQDANKKISYMTDEIKFSFFLLVDGRIWIKIRTNNYGSRSWRSKNLRILRILIRLRNTA